MLNLDFPYQAPTSVCAGFTFRIGEIIKTIPRTETEAAQLKLIEQLHRWYLGDPTLTASPLGEAPNERSQTIDNQVRGAIKLSFQEKSLDITGVIAIRLGMAPHPVIESTE